MRNHYNRFATLMLIGGLALVMTGGAVAHTYIDDPNDICGPVFLDGHDTHSDDIVGSECPEDIRGYGYGDRLWGEYGFDMLSGSTGSDVLYGGPGNDKIYGGGGQDSIIGGADNDDIWGNDGPDLIDCGSGNDVAWGGAGDDQFANCDGNAHE